MKTLTVNPHFSDVALDTLAAFVDANPATAVVVAALVVSFACRFLARAV